MPKFVGSSALAAPNVESFVPGGDAVEAGARKGACYRDSVFVQPP